MLVAIALLGLAPWPGNGPGETRPVTVQEQLARRDATTVAALRLLDCRLATVPNTPAPAPIPWCLAAAPTTTRANPETIALEDGLQRLAEAGLASALAGLRVLHFAHDGRGPTWEAELQKAAPETVRADTDRATVLARELGRSYYLRDQAIIAVRPQFWDLEVRAALLKQFRDREDFAPDLVAFPVYVSLYHEFGHRLLDGTDFGSGRRAESAADLFAASMLAQQFGLPFAKVAKAFIAVRGAREKIEDEAHQNTQMLQLAVQELENLRYDPPPNAAQAAFALIKQAVVAAATGAVTPAQAHPPLPSPPVELVCQAPPGWQAMPPKNRGAGKRSRQR